MIVRSHEPPPPLEDRVVAVLTRRGLLKRSPGQSGGILRRRIFWVAGSLTAVCVALAFGLGRPRFTPAGTGERYLLLLYDDTTNHERPATSATEFRHWADSLRAAGRQVTGEELGPIEERVSEAVQASRTDRVQALVGFFIVDAANLIVATEIARSCPHVRQGGQIVIRPISPT